MTDRSSSGSQAPDTPLPPLPASSSSTVSPHDVSESIRTLDNAVDAGRQDTAPVTLTLAASPDEQTAETEQAQGQEATTGPVSSNLGSGGGQGSGRNFESEFAELSTEWGGQDDEHQNHVHFVLAAEFNIDKGATLTHQYPFPTGTNEQ
jgi:hypothetical protein